MLIFLKILFDIVFLEIERASKIGTPAEFNAERVLEKFAKHDLVTRSLTTGKDSIDLSNHHKTEGLLEIYLYAWNKINTVGIAFM